jgi:caspase domain-containing protein
MSARDFAVVIGIDEYRGLKKLQGAISDATEICGTLIGLGVPEGNIKRVLGKRPPVGETFGWAPRIGEIDDAFADIFSKASRRTPGRLYVYFAGHGCAMERQHVNLLLADAERNALGSGVNASAFEKVLSQMPVFQEQLFFYDCCRVNDERNAGRDPTFHDRVERGAGVGEITQLVHYGTLWQQRTYERPVDEAEQVRGLFTRALCEGLKGSAAERRGEEWVISAGSLKAYTMRRVTQLAGRLNVRGQHPEFNFRSKDENPVLFTGITPQKLDVTVAVEPPGQDDVLAFDRAENVPLKAAVDDGVARFSLVPGAYRFMTLPSGASAPATVEPDEENRFVVTAET